MHRAANPLILPTGTVNTAYCTVALSYVTVDTVLLSYPSYTRKRHDEPSAKRDWLSDLGGHRRVDKGCHADGSARARAALFGVGRGAGRRGEGDRCAGGVFNNLSQNSTIFSGFLKTLSWLYHFQYLSTGRWLAGGTRRAPTPRPLHAGLCAGTVYSF